MTATGISLIRLAQGAVGAPVGSLAWLVSLEPVSEVGGGPAPSAPASAGNYYIVAVTATNGHFVASAHGYASPMPAQ